MIATISAPDSAQDALVGAQMRAAHDQILLDDYSKTIAAVVNRIAPSVVNISVLSGERSQGGGSGFIIARDGFILTNSHVVRGTREIEVTLHDARVYPAQLIGTDPETDLAVVRIDAPDVQHARLADSSQISVGQIAVAVGSPYGFQQTVTAGIVSALGRSMRAESGRVMEVEPGSPAAVAGLKQGDTIVGFKGQPIATVDDLQKHLVASEIGVPSPLMFLRRTEKLFCMVVPCESTPRQTRRREGLK